MGLMKWFIEPFIALDNDEDKKTVDKKPSVEKIKTEEVDPLDVKKQVAKLYRQLAAENPVLEEWEDEEEKSVLFRPETWEQYIGQQRAKNILKSFIKGTQIRERVFPHTLIHGMAGCGKTTLAYLLSKELEVGMKECISSGFDISELENVLNTVNGGILFLDEVHGMSRDVVEQLYSVMEDFKLNGVPIKPFTLIGATTEFGEIIKDRKPFAERFKIIIELEDYKAEELGRIAKQYKETTFPEDSVDINLFSEIGKNSRGTPRTAIRLLEYLIYLDGDLSLALENYGVIKDGYKYKDLKVLRYLNMNGGPVGLNGITSYLNTSLANYAYETENFLIQQEVIQRTPRGRTISPKGIKMLAELEAVVKGRKA